MAGLGDVLDWAKKQVAARVPKADLDQRDADYIREQLPGLWLLASLYSAPTCVVLSAFPPKVRY